MRETNFIRSCPTPPQKLPSLAVCLTLPTKNVACLSSTPSGRVAGGKAQDEGLDRVLDMLAENGVLEKDEDA